MDNVLHIILLTLASYRLTRLLIEDAILDGPRNKLFDRFPPHTSKIGYLFTCYWCLGLWVSAFMVACYLIVPTVAVVFFTVLAVSALVGIVQTYLEK